MRIRLGLVLIFAALASSGEILDRIAVTVGRGIITQSDILKEIRLSSFMNKSQPDFTPASLRKTAERLVERALAETEMEIGRYPAPEPAEAGLQLEALRKEQFPGPGAYSQSLAAAGISEAELRLYLLQQLAMLRFVDARFGPGIQITDEELQAYYAGRFTKEWASGAGKSLPAFEEARAQIEEALRGERVDQMLDQWLKEAKARTRIDYMQEAFQ